MSALLGLCRLRAANGRTMASTMRSIPSALSSPFTGAVATQRAGFKSVAALRTREMPYETLAGLQSFAVKAYAQKPFLGTIKDGHVSWMTYSEFGQLVKKFQGYLLQLGVNRGDRVAVIAGNRPEWAAAAYATYRLGGQWVPMYEQQHPKDWQHIIADSGTKVLLVSNDTILSAVKSFPAPDLQQIRSFESLKLMDDISESLPKVEPDATVRPQDVANIIYTSGTTGLPKGVLLSHNNIISNVKGILTRTGNNVRPDDVNLSILPWAHVYGQVVELHHSMACGTALGLARSTKSVLEDLSIVRPTILIAVPQLYQTVYAKTQERVKALSPLKQKVFEFALKVGAKRREIYYSGGNLLFHPLLQLEFWLMDRIAFKKIKSSMGGRLRYASSGGAALDPAIRNFFGDIGIPIMEGYGLTETSPVCASMQHGPDLRFGMVQLPGVKIYAVDDNLKPLPPGSEGEICIVGPNVMLGYHNNPKATQEVFIEINGEKAFRTGDKGSVDANGALKITGRVKEIYKLINGKYVVPAPVENCMSVCSLVQHAMLFGANKQYNIAIICPNADTLATLPEFKGLTLKEVLENKKNVLLKKISEELEKLFVSYSIKSYERPQKYLLIDEPFTRENHMLTPKLSMKRNIILEKYQAQVDALYAN